MSNRVFIDIMDQNNHDAGTKDRNDAASILAGMGFKTTVMFNRTHSKIQRALEVIKASMEIGKDISEGEIVVIQYPYQPSVMNLILNRLESVKKRCGCRVVLLVHDIVFLRDESYVKQDNEQMKLQEIDIFNRADAVIVHNARMRMKLQAEGVITPMYELGIFDYLYDGKPAVISENKDTRVVFAGNLSPQKSGFIYAYQPCEGIRFNLYGSKPDDLKSNFDYKGSFPPDELIESMEGNYGLVWDGPSADSCEGNYGNYLKYNDPHKFSLYIAAGLPVIVWKESALASFVEMYNVGMSISSLSELRTLPKIESNEYKSFCNNVRKLTIKIQQGDFLRTAVDKILSR